MKNHFLLRSLFVSFLISSSLIAFDLTKDYKEIQCTITPRVQKERSDSHPHIPGANKFAGGARKTAQQTSTNWGGYVAASNLNTPAQNSVTSVVGSWTVPSIAQSKNHSYCALWVGIDGYNSSTVEQIGTEHDWSGGKAVHYAWFEMYPGGSYTINSFPMNVGDVISGSVVYSGNNTFTMQLYNHTQQVVVNIPTSYTKSSKAQRKSVEWVAEAPFLKKILPLANFGTAHFFGCTATINGSHQAIGLLPSYASLEMVTNSGAAKAMPSALLQDKASFSIVWKGQ